MNKEDLITYLASSKTFETKATDLMGNEKIGKVISLDNFTRKAQHKLININELDELYQAIFEYTNIVKEIVKYELLKEVRKSIDTVDTFYN